MLGTKAAYGGDDSVLRQGAFDIRPHLRLNAVDRIANDGMQAFQGLAAVLRCCVVVDEIGDKSRDRIDCSAQRKTVGASSFKSQNSLLKRVVERGRSRIVSVNLSLQTDTGSRNAGN